MSENKILLEQAKLCIVKNGHCPDTICQGCFFVKLTGSAKTCNPENCLKVANEYITENENEKI